MPESMPAQCTAALRRTLAFYAGQKSCPCAFPRFGQLVQFHHTNFGTGPVGCHATEIAIALLTEKKHGIYSVGSSRGGQISNCICNICQSEMDLGWEQYNINLDVSWLVYRIVRPQPLGPSANLTIPMPAGFFGFGREDIQRCARLSWKIRLLKPWNITSRSCAQYNIGMKSTRHKDISKIFADGRAIDSALAKAAQEARRLHALAGVPLVVWINGKTQLIDAKTLRPVESLKKNRTPKSKTFATFRTRRTATK